MTDDKELIARLRDACYLAFDDGTNDFGTAPEAADRIEALTKERDQHWDSFVHWRKEADDRAEQLAAARDDAKEAEAYAEELERELDSFATGFGFKRDLSLEAKLEELRQALLWCSGSADFNEGGVAREGWLKVCAPLLKGESHD